MARIEDKMLPIRSCNGALEHFKMLRWFSQHFSFGMVNTLGGLSGKTSTIRSTDESTPGPVHKPENGPQTPRGVILIQYILRSLLNSFAES